MRPYDESPRLSVAGVALALFNLVTTRRKCSARSQRACDYCRSSSSRCCAVRQPPRVKPIVFVGLFTSHVIRQFTSHKSALITIRVCAVRTRTAAERRCHRPNYRSPRRSADRCAHGADMIRDCANERSRCCPLATRTIQWRQYCRHWIGELIGGIAVIVVIYSFHLTRGPARHPADLVRGQRGRDADRDCNGYLLTRTQLPNTQAAMTWFTGSIDAPIVRRHGTTGRDACGTDGEAGL